MYIYTNDSFTLGHVPYSEKFWRTKKLANLANFIKTTKILVCQIFTPYELGRGRVENT